MKISGRGGGGSFFRAIGGCAFSYGQWGGLLHMGAVTIRDFPGRTPVPISCPIGKFRTQTCESEFTELSQRSL